MSAFHKWDKEAPEAKMKSTLSSEWSYDGPIAIPISPYIRPDSKAILSKFENLLHVESDDTVHEKQSAKMDRPFDVFDEEEYLFGTNLIHNNIGHVGNDVTKLLQMAQEPWPDNVKLFQPYEVEQILLPDNASCLAVQAFLKMCNLPFEVEMRWNAEFMSPSGRVPFIRCGAFVVSELESIVQFCGNKGASLCQRLSTEEKAEMRAYMSLISNVLLNAELYVSWLDNETYSTVTRPRNSSVYPWPLGWLQTRAKRSAVTKRLKALHWYDKTLDQVLNDVEQCCNSLSQRLGDKEYFFGVPTAVDALIYGHTRALLGSVGPKAHLMIRPITTVLLRHAVRVANLTQMKFKPQEDYLIAQALLISQRRHGAASPERASPRGAARARRGRRGDGVSRGSSVFGFKPFVAKQVVVMTTEDGSIHCNSDLCPSNSKVTPDQIDSDENELVGGIVEKLLDKVETMLHEMDTEFAERNDFEIIVEDCERNEAPLKSDVIYKSFEILNPLDVSDESKEDVVSCKDEKILSVDDNTQGGNFELSSGERMSPRREVKVGMKNFKYDLNATLGETKSIFDGDGIVNEKHLEQSISEEAFKVKGFPVSPSLSATLAGIVVGDFKMLSCESPIAVDSFVTVFDHAGAGKDMIQFHEDTNVHQWIQSQIDREGYTFEIPEDENID